MRRRRAHDDGSAGDVGDARYEQVIAKYRDQALRYDSFMARTERWRRRAIEALQLEPGMTVLDVACGTGSNFDPILDKIGAGGTLIGVDVSGEMLSVAAAGVKSRTATNVKLVEAPAEGFRLETTADRALFSFTHDVLQSPGAVDNVARQLTSGAKVAAVGSKRANAWNLPLNALTRIFASRYVTSFRNFDRPWSELARIAELEIETFAFGAVYLAQGPVRSTVAADD